MNSVVDFKPFDLRLLDISPTGMILINLAGEITYANKKAEEILDLTASGISERAYNSMEWIATDFEGNAVSKEKRAFTQVIEKNTSVFDIEYAVEWPNGKKVYLSINASPIQNEVGTVEGVFTCIEDITNSITTKQRLEQSEKQYKDLFDNLIEEVHIWKFITDVDGLLEDWELIDANPIALKNWGKKLEEVQGKLATEIFGNESVESFYPIVNDIFITGKANSWEAHFPPTDQYLSMDSIPFGDKFISTGRDITKRKQAELQLEEAKELAESNETRLNNLLTNLETGVVIHAADTSIISCNKRSQEILGLSEDQMRGKVAIDPYWTFIYEDGTPLPIDDYPVMRVIKTKTALKNQVLGVQVPNNEIVWLDVNGFPVFNDDNEILEITISFIDITERKLAEENLVKSKEKAEESETRLSLATESGQLGIWDWNIKDNILIWDDIMYKMYGESKDTEEKTVDLWSRGLHPDDKENALEELNNALEGKTSFNTSFRIVRLNGDELHIKADGIVTRDTNGNPIRMIGINRDMTDSKTKELELEKTIIEKEVLLAEVHHRVKNNLALISAMLYLQQKEYKNDDFEELIVDTQSRIKSIANVHELIYQNESFIDIRVDQYIERISDQLKRLYVNDPEQINFTIDLEPIVLIIEQAIPIALIINEVLTNTFKHAFDEDMSGKIEIELKHYRDSVILEITDNGKGLPDNFNVDESDSLGFTLIKQFTIQLDGKYEFSCPSTGGTNFFLSFQKTEI